MNTVAKIQVLILNETGIKTSVSHLTGSMKGYIRFSPINKEMGIRPQFSDEQVNTLTEKIPHKRKFISWFTIEIHSSQLTDTEPIIYPQKRLKKQIYIHTLFGV